MLSNEVDFIIYYFMTETIKLFFIVQKTIKNAVQMFLDSFLYVLTLTYIDKFMFKKKRKGKKHVKKIKEL